MVAAVGIGVGVALLPAGPVPVGWVLRDNLTRANKPGGLAGTGG